MFCKERFTTDLNNIDWKETLAIKSNYAKVCKSFVSTITNLLDKHAPEKKLNKNRIQTVTKTIDYTKYSTNRPKFIKHITLETLLRRKFKTYRNHLVELIK